MVRAALLQYEHRLHGRRHLVKQRLSHSMAPSETLDVADAPNVIGKPSKVTCDTAPVQTGKFLIVEFFELPGQRYTFGGELLELGPARRQGLVGSFRIHASRGFAPANAH